MKALGVGLWGLLSVVSACSGTRSDLAASGAGAGTDSAAGSAGSAGASPGKPEPVVEATVSFDGAVSRQTFSDEVFYEVWGTENEVWVLGIPEPAPVQMGGGNIAPILECGPDRFASTSILRRKTTADFVTVDHPASTTLMGLHGSSAGDVWMVGLAGAVHQFDGRAWRTHDIRGAEGLAFHEDICWEISLQGVFARSPEDVWVVGYINPSDLGPGLILHYDGQGWRRDAVDAPDGFFGVWAASESDVWAVGSSGLVYHYDGLSWQRVNAATDHYLYSVLGTGPGDVWAVGNTAVATHFDGSAWQLVSPSQDYAGRDSLAGSLEEGIWSLMTKSPLEQDQFRQSLTYWVDDTWREESFTTDPEQALSDLYMTSSGELWGVGRSIVRFR